MRDKTFETKKEILSEKNYLTNESKLEKSKEYFIGLAKKVGVFNLTLAGIGILGNNHIAHAEVSQVMNGTLLMSFIEKTESIKEVANENLVPNLFKPLRKEVITIAIAVTIISLIFKILECIADDERDKILKVVCEHLFALLIMAFVPTFIDTLSEYLGKHYS